MVCAHHKSCRSGLQSTAAAAAAEAPEPDGVGSAGAALLFLEGARPRSLLVLLAIAAFKRLRPCEPFLRRLGGANRGPTKAAAVNFFPNFFLSIFSEAMKPTPTQAAVALGLVALGLLVAVDIQSLVLGRQERAFEEASVLQKLSSSPFKYHRITVPDSPGIRGDVRERLTRALDYAPALPRQLLDRAVAVQGDTIRLRRAMSKLLAGAAARRLLLGTAQRLPAAACACTAEDAVRSGR